MNNCGNFVLFFEKEHGKRAEFIHLVSQYKGAGPGISLSDHY